MRNSEMYSSISNDSFNIRVKTGAPFLCRIFLFLINYYENIIQMLLLILLYSYW